MLEGIAPHQFEQVLTNLVNNSIEAVGAEGGQIEIRLARKGSEALVTVTDDGPGIPAEVMPDIFEPFFTTKEAGTGLGLVVCRTLVERAGGSIEVSSVPASGTTFELTFSIRDRECCPDGKIV
jgi:signal transduction histidine kinase